jgi:hypothetical protein
MKSTPISHTLIRPYVKRKREKRERAPPPDGARFWLGDDRYCKHAGWLPLLPLSALNVACWIDEGSEAYSSLLMIFVAGADAKYLMSPTLSETCTPLF